jgi:hypothetical protein
MLSSLLKILGGVAVAGTGSYVVGRGVSYSVLNSISKGPLIKTVGGVALTGVGVALVYGGYMYTTLSVLDMLTGKLPPKVIARDFGNFIDVEVRA